MNASSLSFVNMSNANHPSASPISSLRLQNPKNAFKRTAGSSGKLPGPENDAMMVVVSAREGKVAVAHVVAAVVAYCALE